MIKPILRALALLACCAAAHAADPYPSQPIRLLIGFPPGGTTDVVGRLVAQELGEGLGKAVIVDNRGGASGTIATGVVAKSQPDGYTLVLVSSAHGTVPALYNNLPYTEAELAPIAMIAATPYLLVVHPSMPVKDMGTLINYLKANPGKIEFASSSPGTGQHLAGELLKRSAGVNIMHVPYKGTGQLMPDVLAGRVPMLFENVAVIVPHVKAGKLRAIAISSLKRSALMPDVPTVASYGGKLSNFEVLGWFSLIAPAKTPREILARLNAEVNRMIAKPAVKEKLQGLGAEPLGSTIPEAAQFIKSEQDKWGKVIHDAGITPQ
ncbi:MAG TPA: tripartite tricarboxylate transporter substrate binding protein [Burkholderiales bacterium]|jgi:tripartite-type tricarboxylate transporter receptor subunit TctC